MQNVIGSRFARYLVINESERLITPKGISLRVVKAQCDCGVVKDVLLHHLRSGLIKSCGCLQQENRTTHGMRKTRTYTAWQSMVQRCREKSASRLRYYDRGITVCDDWKDFEAFYRDMGEAPDGLELDRIDNDKGYSKENCRWTTRTIQMRNIGKRTNPTQSIYKGVGFHKQRKKWRAAIRINGKSLHIGLFDTEGAAAMAYNEIASKIEGFALNKIIGEPT